MKIKVAVIDTFQSQLDILCEFIKEFHKDIDPIGFSDPINAKNTIIESADFDLLITDHITPLMESDILVSEVFKHYHPKIILMTIQYNYEILKDSNLYDFTIEKPIDFKEFNRLIDMLKYDIYRERESLIHSTTEEITKGRCSVKSSSILKNVIKTLIYDEGAKNRVYNKLSHYALKSATINTTLDNITKALDIESINKLGFNKKPQNIEFLQKMVSIVETELAEDKKAVNL